MGTEAFRRFEFEGDAALLRPLEAGWVQSAAEAACAGGDKAASSYLLGRCAREQQRCGRYVAAAALAAAAPRARRRTARPGPQGVRKREAALLRDGKLRAGRDARLQLNREWVQLAPAAHSQAMASPPGMASSALPVAAKAPSANKLPGPSRKRMRPFTATAVRPFFAFFPARLVVRAWPSRGRCVKGTPAAHPHARAAWARAGLAVAGLATAHARLRAWHVGTKLPWLQLAAGVGRRNTCWFRRPGLGRVAGPEEPGRSAASARAGRPPHVHVALA